MTNRIGDKKMRNADALRKVADEIEANGKTRPEFYMGSWLEVTGNEDEIHVCNTTACIAGYAVFALKPEKFMQDAKLTIEEKRLAWEEEDHYWDGIDYSDIGAELLGLNSSEAYCLFESSFNATKEDAADYLRYLADNPNEPVVNFWANQDFDWRKSHEG